jgi:hypothetical protein
MVICDWAVRDVVFPKRGGSHQSGLSAFRTSQVNASFRTRSATHHRLFFEGCGQQMPVGFPRRHSLHREVRCLAKEPDISSQGRQAAIRSGRSKTRLSRKRLLDLARICANVNEVGAYLRSRGSSRAQYETIYSSTKVPLSSTGRRQKELDEAVKAIGRNVVGVRGEISNYRTSIAFVPTS